MPTTTTTTTTRFSLFVDGVCRRGGTVKGGADAVWQAAAIYSPWGTVSCVCPGAEDTTTETDADEARHQAYRDAEIDG